MDVKLYFQKIRSLEQQLPEGNVVVSSCKTADGGRPGRAMELTRSLAAKMIVDGKVRLATEQESAEYRSAFMQAQEDIKAREQMPQRSFLVDLAAARRSAGPVKGKKG